MLLRLLLVGAHFVVGAWGFLGRAGLVEGYGDVLGVVCPEFDPQTPIWDHVEITKEGVRRTVIEFFKDLSKENNRGGSYRLDMTLEEAYRAYHNYDYGNSPPSTKRLLRALQDISDAAAETHAGGMGSQPMYHFNNEQFETSHAMLQARWGRLVGALKSFDVTAVRYLLGTSLAALQDFYAHSNWIELGHDSILEDLGRESLRVKFIAAGLNATSHYLNELRRAVGNQLFSHLLSLHWRSPVAIVTDVLISFPTWSNPIGLSSSYSSSHKHEPEESLLVLYSNTLRGATGMFRSSSMAGTNHARQYSYYNSSVSLRDALAGLHAAAHAALPDTEVFLLTEGTHLRGAVGVATPQHTLELLLSKRIKVTPLVVGRTEKLVVSNSWNSSSEPNSTLDMLGLGDTSDTPQRPDGGRGEVQPLSASRVYQILAEVALMTGGHIIDVPSTADITKALSPLSEGFFHGEVQLYRDIAVSTASIVNMTVDNHIRALRVTLYGAFAVATVTLDGGGY
ncbi:uncharacterized protein LOC108667813 [Hyalella azteca]|uniref:Uncharacterized protein LOC108667813 n=1 Tax=Hyalella azteca TaxID=294128 RepID=A0A979FMR8_HYAAZ|nr:uncharacterized protein LOC108667813 [Hyalella azteca]